MPAPHKKSLLEEREKLHAMLLSSVSHDLKTPLACVIGSLEIYRQLKVTLSEEHKATLIDTAIDEARRLDSFVTNILDMAKLERGERLKCEPADLVELLRRCTLQMEPHLRAHNVQLELPPQLMAEVSASWIGRAVMLLLDNAARYTPAGTRIRVYAESDGTRFRIVVEDEGPGIAKKRLGEIFLKRARVKRQDAKTAGTGLGLPICKAIARAHRGSIRVDSPPGKGTAFTLVFPHAAAKQKKKSVKTA